MGYTKQNAGAALNWRPTKEWNLGAQYGFERYDWTRADVDVTNENSGKLYGDWKPFTWFTLRTSGSYGARRYDNYNYLGYVGNFQWSCATPTVIATCDTSEQYQTTYRQLMIDNRDLGTANVSADITVVHNLTLTPTVKYTDAKYGVDPNAQQGLQDSQKWAAGIDATYLLNPDTSFMVGYMYERGSQLLFGTVCTSGALCTTTAPIPCQLLPTTLAPCTRSLLRYDMLQFRTNLTLSCGILGPTVLTACNYGSMAILRPAATVLPAPPHLFPGWYSVPRQPHLVSTGRCSRGLYLRQAAGRADGLEGRSQGQVALRLGAQC